MDYNIFGARLRQLRLKQHISLSAVARRLGFSVPHLSHVEQGKRAPFSLETILKIQTALNLDDNQTLGLAHAAASHRKGLSIKLSDIEETDQGGWLVVHMLLYGSKKTSFGRSNKT